MALVTTVDRTTTVAGPAILTTTAPGGAAGSGTSFVFEDALTVKFTTDTAEIKVNGIVRNRIVLQKNILISGKPVGIFRDVPKIFPFGYMIPGARLFGADAPLLLQPYDTTQSQITFASGAVTKMPDLNLTAGAPLFDGDMEFTCLGKNATLSSDAAYRYTEAANTFAGDSYDDSKLIISAYDVSHPLLNGGAPFDTEAGVKVVFNPTITDLKSDSLGTYNKLFSGMNPTATFVPIGVSEADIRAALGLQGANAVRGSRLSANAGDLVCAGNGVYFKLPHCAFSEGSDVFSTTAQRAGQLTATGTNAAGTVASPFFILGTAAPM